MSETAKVSIGSNAASLNVSPQFDTYSGVEIVVSEETSFFAGNRTGRVLSIENAWGTQEQANAILASLQSRGYQYQPFSASGAMLDPAAEIGDGITISDTYSGLYKITRNYVPLMTADLEAPQEEEIDHEYPYEPKQDRVYKREIADAKAQISVNTDAITAEVFRATTAEESLQSAITQTAGEISANVLKKTGGSASSFGWTLNDSSWELKANGSTVFKATASGVEISGKVTATSGTIGGFNIGSSALYNGTSGLWDGGSGVYVGTDGISVGGGAFRVTSSGAVSANNMTLTGTLNLGGTYITPQTLASRATSAYNWTSSNGSYCYSGAGYGYNYNSALGKNASGSPSWFSAYNLQARSQFFLGNQSLSIVTKQVKNALGSNITIHYLGYDS